MEMKKAGKAQKSEGFDNAMHGGKRDKTSGNVFPTVEPLD